MLVVALAELDGLDRVVEPLEVGLGSLSSPQRSVSLPRVMEAMGAVIAAVPQAPISAKSLISCQR